jgi:proteasome lid subunit RPN8/RPN11
MKPLTTSDVVAAGRRMLSAGTPRSPREIQERMDAIDAAMACLNGPNYGTDFYYKLGREWSRLSAVLSGGSSRSVLGRTPATRSVRDADPRRNAAPFPESWRLPERSRATVEPPSIRLDADTAPRVKVILVRSAFVAITAECSRWRDDAETGGWLVGHRAFSWHRERTVTSATVAATLRKAGKVTLDEGEFVRMDTQLQAQRDRDGDLRGIGDWHTHPMGGSRPSQADLRCQARELATIGDHNVSLTSPIVTRRDGRESWNNPHISAWVTRHARSSFGERMVCEPAMVSVG